MSICGPQINTKNYPVGPRSTTYKRVQRLRDLPGDSLYKNRKIVPKRIASKAEVETVNIVFKV